MDAKIIAVANQKGGVGKTTTALSLGAALARKEKQVLIVDLDPHVCASVHLRLYPDDYPRSVCDIFLADPQDWAQLWTEIIQRPEEQRLDVALGHVRLSELEGDLRERPRKGFILREALAGLKSRYDYIILDCPPHLGVLLVNALVASDLLIMPIQTDFLALHGLKLIFDTIRTLNKALSEPVTYRALPTMFDRRTRACRNVLDLLRIKMDNAMFTTIVPLDTRFRDASALGQVIFDVEPSSRGARAYEDLAEEVTGLW
jgi:chromosome partitioning protein